VRKVKSKKLAQDIDGTIIQMSAGYWSQKVAQTLNSLFELNHPLVTLEHADIENYLRSRIQNVPPEAFIDFAIEEG